MNALFFLHPLETFPLSLYLSVLFSEHVVKSTDVFLICWCVFFYLPTFSSAAVPWPLSSIAIYLNPDIENKLLTLKATVLSGQP